MYAQYTRAWWSLQALSKPAMLESAGDAPSATGPGWQVLVFDNRLFSNEITLTHAGPIRLTHVRRPTFIRSGSPE